MAETDIRTVNQVNRVTRTDTGLPAGQAGQVKPKLDRFTLVKDTSKFSFSGAKAVTGPMRHLAGSANPVEAIYAQVDTPGGTALNRRGEMIKNLNSLIEG